MDRKDLVFSVLLILIVGSYAGWQRAQPGLEEVKSLYEVGAAPQDSALVGAALRREFSAGKLSVESSPPVGEPPGSGLFGRLSSPRLHEAPSLAVQRYFNLPAEPPAPHMSITSPFGWRVDPLADEVRYHVGVDIAQPSGSPVLAPGGGTVEEIGYARGYGLYVVLRHNGTGYTSRLAHLSGFVPHLEEGQPVRRGQLLAFSGSTGRVTGAHLHFEITGPDGTPVDPGEVYEEYRRVRHLLLPPLPGAPARR